MSGVDRIYIVPPIALGSHHPTTGFFFFSVTIPLSYSLLLTDTFSRLLLSPMTSVETVPSFLQAAVPILQPSHLEGDPTLATEVLPGPPSLLSVQQSAVRKDTKKPSFALSYLPTSDPGSTYSVLGLAHTPTVVSMGVDGPRRKRPRTSKVCVSPSFYQSSCADSRRIPPLPWSPSLQKLSYVSTSAKSVNASTPGKQSDCCRDRKRSRSGNSLVCPPSRHHRPILSAS